MCVFDSVRGLAGPGICHNTCGHSQDTERNPIGRPLVVREDAKCSFTRASHTRTLCVNLCLLKICRQWQRKNLSAISFALQSILVLRANTRHLSSLSALRGPISRMSMLLCDITASQKGFYLLTVPPKKPGLPLRERYFLQCPALLFKFQSNCLSSLSREIPGPGILFLHTYTNSESKKFSLENFPWPKQS